MLNFEAELKKFKPLPNIDHIEEQIEKEDTRDVMDLIKKCMEERNIETLMKNYSIDKES